MVASSQFSLTPDEYLQREAKSPVKHEYINGEIYAMAGSTDSHNTLVGNLFALIRTHSRGTDCRVYFADIKVRLESQNCFYYPDLLVTCDPQDRETPTYKRFPKLIVEVLSGSSEAFDRGDKFKDYQTLNSLEEYVLVNSKRQRVESFRRNSQGWLYQAYTPTDPALSLQSLQLNLSFPDLYEDVSLA
ncbi:MAG: Uma2 family endonuclease [Chloroflexaceae bacterium]|nr:Uma2 family endonuclease [Chloroflexaceae bacterium]